MLEILVASAIFSIIGIMLFGVFTSVISSGDGLAQRAELAHTARFIVRKLTEDLSAASLLPNNTEGVFVGADNKTGKWETDEIRFTGFGRLTFLANSSSDQALIAWYVKSGKDGGLFSLVRSENPFILGGEISNERAEQMEVTDRLRSFQIRYLQSSGWNDKFDSKIKNKLPKAVSYEFTLEDKEGRRLTRSAIASVGGLL